MPGNHHLRGSNKHPKKNRLAASRLVDDAPHRHYFGQTPPPLSKKLDPPLDQQKPIENIYWTNTNPQNKMLMDQQKASIEPTFTHVFYGFMLVH